MPLLWLRVALIFYAVGVAHALFSLARRREFLNRVLMLSILLGAVFHFVSLVELTILTGERAPTTVHHSESLLGFCVIIFFVAFSVKYRSASPGVSVFLLVCLLALERSFAVPAPEF